MRENKNLVSKMAVVSVAMLGLVLFAGSSEAANNLTVVAPGLNSTNYGLQVNVEPGQSNNIFVESAHPTDETHYRIKFWVDPTNLDIPCDRSIRMGVIGSYADGASGGGQRIVLFLRNACNSGNPIYQLNAWAMEDSGYPATYRFLTGVFLCEVSAPSAQQVEVEWTAATGPATTDGIYKVSRLGPNPGSQQVTNLDMSDFTVQYIRIGALAGTGSNALSNSSYMFDEFESYR
jgi:hypothetical protein